MSTPTLPAPSSPAPMPVTEQMTRHGRAIEHDSFAVIDAEVGPHAYTPGQWPLVRRMIHANADFDFNGLTRFHPDAVRAGVAALRQGGCPIVADVDMICTGLSKPRLAHFGATTQAFISDALKVAFRKHQFPEYMQAFAAVRQQFSRPESVPSQGAA